MLLRQLRDHWLFQVLAKRQSFQKVEVGAIAENVRLILAFRRSEPGYGGECYDEDEADKKAPTERKRISRHQDA